MKKGLFAQDRDGLIFRAESVLYPEFVPDALLHRDRQIRTMVYALEPVLKGKKPLNVFLFGPTGVGKTSCARFVLRELEQESDRAKHLYVNCFEFGSRASILVRLANFLGAPFPRRGLGADEAFERILECLRKTEFVPVIILDEVDQLVRLPAEAKVLYDLLRVSEYQPQRICLVLISNDPSIGMQLDARIKSSLMEESVEFAAYSPSELKSILSERADAAFFPQAISKEIVAVAAAHAARAGGDARIAIESLLKAGRLAEKAGKSRVELSDLQAAFVEVDSVSIMKSVSFLDSFEKDILRTLAGLEGEVTSGRLRDEYFKIENHLNERAFRRKLEELAFKKLVSRTTKELGNQGKTMLLSLNVPRELLKRKLGVR
ncbi:MAG: AAA family ATPase [Candidatus Diapherotrites archaeon]|nr:AAA family ATPase [Candidatus Diapherotrites archaeon]